MLRSTLTLCGFVCGWFCCLVGQAQERLPNPFDLLPEAQATPAAAPQVEQSTPAPATTELPKSASDSPPTQAPTREENFQQNSTGQLAGRDSSSDTGASELAESSEQGRLPPAGEVADPMPADDRPGADSGLGDGQLPLPPKAEVAKAEAIRFDVPVVDQVLEKSFAKALLIDANGPIFGRFHWYLNQRLDIAKRDGVDLVLIRLTTPGGYVDEAIQLGRRLRDVDWATTIVFVPDETISGGAIIALGADRIYMRPQALIGDAGPVRMGMGGQFEHAEEKVVSYLAEAIRSLAEAKGRPGALAQAMVDRQFKVFEAIEIATGKRVYLSESELKKDPQGLHFQVGDAVPEAGENRFLTVNGNRALELGLCEGVFNSEDQLLAALRIDQLQETKLTWVDSTVYVLNRPVLTAILLIIGLIGLYLEIAAPGISVAGLTSMLCFGLFFWSHALGGTSGWLEVVLFAAGVICILCEMFVLPGFGVFGISGIVLVVFSLVMASQDFVLPEDPMQWRVFQRNLLLVLASVFGVILLFIGHVLFLDSLPGLNRFKLSTPEDAGGEFTSPGLTGLTHSSGKLSSECQIGAEGVADSDLRPSGKVRIGDQLLDVVTEGDYVSRGTPVQVLRVEGNRVTVRAK